MSPGIGLIPRGRAACEHRKNTLLIQINAVDSLQNSINGLRTLRIKVYHIINI
jgi:hypothetical protein